MNYSGSVEFIHLAKLLLRSRGSIQQALAMVNAKTPTRVKEIIEKAAVAGGNIADSAWAGALAPYNVVSNSFVESLAQHSAFDRIASDTVVVPSRTSIAWITTGAVGYSPAAPGAPKPLTKLALSSDGVDTQTASVLVVVTEELLNSPGVESFLARELRKGISTPTDSILVTALTEGLSPVAADFSSAANVATALGSALATMALGASSKVYVLVDAATAQLLALTTASGTFAFPDMTINGGSIGGIAVIVTSALDAGTAVVVDTTGVATASDGPVVIDASKYTTLQMDDAAPQNSVTPTATNVVSLFQTDSVALRAERRVGALRFRDDSVVLLGLSS